MTKADGMDELLIKVRKILWLIVMGIFLALTVKLVLGVVVPALRPHETDAAMYAEMYGPVRASMPALILAWLTGFAGCAWGLRQAWRSPGG